MSCVVFDAGALIAIERNDRALWAALKVAAAKSDEVIVPSTALAQVWRGTATQASLARAMRHVSLASFDAVARAVGEICGRTRTMDICDAHVALVASRQGDVLYTSDPGDMSLLMAACRTGRHVVVIRC